MSLSQKDLVLEMAGQSATLPKPRCIIHMDIPNSSSFGVPSTSARSIAMPPGYMNCSAAPVAKGASSCCRNCDISSTMHLCKSYRHLSEPA